MKKKKGWECQRNVGMEEEEVQEESEMGEKIMRDRKNGKCLEVTSKHHVSFQVIR